MWYGHLMTQLDHIFDDGEELAEVLSHESSFTPALDDFREYLREAVSNGAGLSAEVIAECVDSAVVCEWRRLDAQGEWPDAVHGMRAVEIGDVLDVVGEMFTSGDALPKELDDDEAWTLIAGAALEADFRRRRALRRLRDLAGS